MRYCKIQRKIFPHKKMTVYSAPKFHGTQVFEKWKA